MRRKGGHKGKMLPLLLVFLVGLAIFLYPTLNSYFTGKRMGSSVESFFGTAPTDTALDDLLPTESIPETEPPTPYPEVLELLEQYNRDIYADGQAKLNSLAATEQAGVLFCVSGQQSEIAALYNEVIVSDDYCEAVKLFASRLSKQAEETRAEVFSPKFQGIDMTPLSSTDCTPISHDDDLHGKIVVIRPDVLRREYQLATRQLKLCIGGFGASPHSRGSACFCVDLYSGDSSRFERRDILGTLEPEQLPQWAKLGLEQYQREHAEKRKERER